MSPSQTTDQPVQECFPHLAGRYGPGGVRVHIQVVGAVRVGNNFRSGGGTSKPPGAVGP